MIAAALLVALGGIVFVEQDLPEARVEPSWFVPTGAEPNFLRTDIDSDGAADLVFKSHVVFQRDGVFSQDHRVELPEGLEDASRDVWQGRIYLRRPDRLTVLRWDGAAWEEDLGQTVKWPDIPAKSALGGVDDTDESGEDSGEGDEDDPGREFERFLHDLDGDGTPELIIPSFASLHLYVNGDAGYVETHELDVFPPAQTWGGGALWPADQREIGFPEQERFSWFLVEGNEVTVADRRRAGRDLTRLDIIHYTLDEAFAILAEGTKHHEMPPRRGWPAPAHLNSDGVVDFVCWDLGGLRTSPMPTPILDIAVSTDGGETFQTFRSSWVFARCLFVDFDGDGDMDMVSADTGVFRGGIRESVTRLFTQRTIEHELQIRLQDATGVFARSPDLRIPLSIRLDKPLFRRTDMAWRYAESDLAALAGDFNGDGRPDLAVQDRPDRLAVFLQKDGVFGREPDATLQTQPDWRFGITDIDLDGRSDLSLFPLKKDDEGEPDAGRVYLTRGSSP